MDEEARTANWPPSKLDMLLALYGASETITVSREPFEMVAGSGKGLSIYDPEFTGPLIDDGLAEKVSIEDDGYSIHATVLTEKGKEAAEMFLGKRNASKFSQPDWFLIELTK